MITARREYEDFLNELKRLVNGPPYFGAIYEADVERLFGRGIGQKKLQKFIDRMIDEGEAKKQGGLLVLLKVAEKIGERIMQEEEKILNDTRSIDVQIKELEKRIQATERLRDVWTDYASEPDIANYCTNFWSSIIQSDRKKMDQLYEEKKKLEERLNYLRSIIKMSRKDNIRF